MDWHQLPLQAPDDEWSEDTLPGGFVIVDPDQEMTEIQKAKYCGFQTVEEFRRWVRLEEK